MPEIIAPACPILLPFGADLPAIKADIGFLINEEDKNFVKIKDKKLPFRNNEFDFVISSHVIDHVEDFEFFLTKYF